MESRRQHMSAYSGEFSAKPIRCPIGYRRTVRILSVAFSIAFFGGWCPTAAHAAQCTSTADYASLSPSISSAPTSAAAHESPHAVCRNAMFGLFVVLFSALSIAAPFASDSANSGSCPERADERQPTPAAESRRPLEVATLLTVVGPDLRTSLAGVVGFADLLTSNADHGNAQERDAWTRIVRASAHRAAELLDGILQVAQLADGTLLSESTQCDLTAVVRETVESLVPAANEQHVALKFIPTLNVPATLCLDVRRVQQIVARLVTQAVHRRKHSSVKVSLSCTPTNNVHQIRIAVCDSGPALSPSQVAALSCQSNAAPPTSDGGTNAEFMLAREFARRLGGDIELASSTDAGNTFALMLTAAPHTPAAAPQTQNGPGIRDGARRDMRDVRAERASLLRGWRILIADDSDSTRRLLQYTLAGAGAELVLVSDGKAAVQAATTAQFDVVIIDADMPILDGFNAAQQMRQRGVTAPIIALTALTAADDRAKCLASGCTEYLAKPLQMQTLIDTLIRTTPRPRPVTQPPAADVSAGGAISTTGPQRRTPTELYSELLAIEDADARAIAADWLRELPQRIAEIRDALNRNDAAGAAWIAHALKGASGTLGMFSFFEPTRQIEAACNSASPDDARRALQRLEDLLPASDTQTA